MPSAASRSTSRTGACSPCAAYNPAFLHPEDLRHIGAQPGDIVRIDSDHDFIYGVAEASVDVRPGVVSMAHAQGDAPERDGEVRTIGSGTSVRSRPPSSPP